MSKINVSVASLCTRSFVFLPKQSSGNFLFIALVEPLAINYLSLLKTGSLVNAIQDFLLA